MCGRYRSSRQGGPYAADIFAGMPTATPAATEELVRSVLERLNGDLPAADRFAISDDTVIMGDAGVLDSLGIANFIVGLEEEVQRAFGVELALSDQDLAGLFEQPQVTVQVFAAFVHQRASA